MIGTLKLVGLYVQPDQKHDREDRREFVPGFAVEVVEVGDQEKSGGGRVFEGRILGLARREMNHTRPYSTPLRENMRRWWQVETYGAPVPEELLELGEDPSPEEEKRFVI